MTTTHLKAGVNSRDVAPLGTGSRHAPQSVNVPPPAVQPVQLAKNAAHLVESQNRTWIAARPAVHWRRMVIDTSFDFRSDTPSRKDPDAHSPTLRRYHKLLWSKVLPGGALLNLDDAKRGTYLHHRSALGEFFLSSDSVVPTFTRWVFAKAHPEIYTEDYNKAFMAISYTIGGMMRISDSASCKLPLPAQEKIVAKTAGVPCEP
jgi:hypothetical protein